jgi:steroid delta-isomerase-like uncharacterized protein
MTARTKELARRHFEVINARDRAGFVELHADDIAHHGPDGTVTGVEKFADHDFGLFDTVPDLTFVVEEVFGTENRATARFMLRGTDEGELFGVEPTGEQFELTSTSVFHVEDGQIVEIWTEADRLGLLEQLGALD